MKNNQLAPITEEQQNQLNDLLFSVVERNEEDDLILDENGSPCTVSGLVARGANVNSVNDEGESVLSRAVFSASTIFGREDSIEVLKDLLRSDVDVNFVNRDKTIPLTGAVRYGSSEVAKLLLEKGASVNAQHSIVVVGLNTPFLESFFYCRSEKANEEHPRADVVNAMITATLHRNDANDWQGFEQQLQNRQFKNFVTRDLLTRESAVLLAAALPEGELRTLIVKKFNQGEEISKNEVVELSNKVQKVSGIIVKKDDVENEVDISPRELDFLSQKNQSQNSSFFTGIYNFLFGESAANSNHENSFKYSLLLAQITRSLPENIIIARETREGVPTLQDLAFKEAPEQLIRNVNAAINDLSVASSNQNNSNPNPTVANPQFSNQKLSQTNPKTL